MTYSKLALALSSALLFGCSDGGSTNTTSDDEPIGSLLSGDLSFVQFATDSNSGYLSQEGKFSYAKGDMVSFTFGGYTTKKVDPSATITLFELFDAPRLTTHFELQQALGYGSYGKSEKNFQRMVNFIALLVLLDEDFNLLNGVQLRSNLDAEKFIESINLDHEWRLFPSEVLGPRLRAQGFEMEYPFEYGLAQYYDYEDIKVKGYFTKSISVSSTDINGLTEGWTYYENGLPKTRYEDENNDGKFEQVANFVWGDNLKVSTLQSESYQEGVLVRDSSISSTYDTFANQIKDTIESNDDSGNSKTVITVNRNNKGIRHLYTTESYSNDVIQYRTQETFQYSNGILNQTIESLADGSPGDDVWERRSIWTQKYSSDGSVAIYSQTQEDYEADGVIDHEYGTETTYENGRILSVLYTAKSGNPLSLFSNDIREYEYDSNGNQTKETYLYRYDTNLQDHTRQRISTLTYDANNNRTSDYTETDVGRDGTIDSVVSNVYQYDELGRLISTTFIDDSTYGGVIEFQSINLVDYNDLGLVIKESGENREDGACSSKYTQTHTYNSEGFIIKSVNKEDQNCNDSIEFEATYDYQYVEIEDAMIGVLRAIQDFL